jgi:predicted ester cyclase
MSRTDEETRNTATFQRFHEATNSGDPELVAKTIDELVAPDVVIRTPLPIDATGVDALKQVWAMLLRGLPDLRITVEDVLAEGDKVACRNTVTGTHLGEYMGVPPTGRSNTYNEIKQLGYVPTLRP